MNWEDWRFGLTDKARKALARRFTVGIVREDCEDQYKDVIGAQSLVFEFRASEQHDCTVAVVARLNRLAELNLLIGTRQEPEIVYVESEGRWIMCGRVMIAPGRWKEACEVA
jgi:hypothetical protein